MQSPVTFLLIGGILSITTFQFSQIYDSPSFCSSTSTVEIRNTDYSNTKRKIDYRSPRIEQYVKEFKWLYFNHLDQGFKCKICELFPHSGVGQSKTKFHQEALKSLGDHPCRTLSTRQESTKHKESGKEYEVNCECFCCNKYLVFSVL